MTPSAILNVDAGELRTSHCAPCWSRTFPLSAAINSKQAGSAATALGRHPNRQPIAADNNFIKTLLSEALADEQGIWLSWAAPHASHNGEPEREEFVVKAYVIAAETVNDPAMFDLYRRQVPATLVPFGGQFVVRGESFTVLEGEWPHPRVVIIAFPSRTAAEGWYKSAEYQEIISLRHKSSVGNLIIVDGFAAQ
jgi:uncharacterized protein (DUF1330 family)